MEYTYFDDIPNANATPEIRTKYHKYMNNTERKCYQESNTVNGIKIIKNNYKIQPNEELIKNSKIRIHCSECDSELEITEEDTHIGWMGARFINCPCCGKEAMVDELDGITLTKDNLEFPVHFNRITKGLRNIVEVNSDEIIKEIQRGITYFRVNKDEYYWYASYGDLFLIVFRYSGDEEYFVMVTKDFYETYIPFEKEDYDENDNKSTRLRDTVDGLKDAIDGFGNMI